jgi:hypothetical protein
MGGWIVSRATGLDSALARGVGVAAMVAMVTLSACATDARPADPAARAVYDECDALALRPASSEATLSSAISRDDRRMQCMVARGVRPQ